MTREEDLEKPQVEQMGAHHPADTTKSTPCSETGAGSMTDAQLVRFARAFRRGIVGPRGSSAQMCFAVCAPLEGLLSGRRAMRRSCLAAEPTSWSSSTLRHCRYCHSCLQLDGGH